MLITYGHEGNYKNLSTIYDAAILMYFAVTSVDDPFVTLMEEGAGALVTAGDTKQYPVNIIQWC